MKLESSIGDAGALEALLSYWKSKRGDRRMPRRGDIDPVEIPRLLSSVSLVDRVDGRFRFRLVGTAIAEAFGCDPTGMFFDEFLPQRRFELAQILYTRLFTDGRPLLVHTRLQGAFEQRVIAHRLVLPLSGAGITVDCALAGMNLEVGWYNTQGALSADTPSAIAEDVDELP